MCVPSLEFIEVIKQLLLSQLILGHEDLLLTLLVLQESLFEHVDPESPLIYLFFNSSRDFSLVSMEFSMNYAYSMDSYLPLSFSRSEMNCISCLITSISLLMVREC